MILILAILLDSCSGGNGENILYVAPSGSDNAMGSLKDPLGTLAGARDRLRELRASGQMGDFTVILREGYYLQEKTFTLGMEDGGGDSCVISYAAYPGEEAIIGSGLVVKEWKKPEKDPEFLPEEARGKVWVANLPSGVDWFATLYDGEERLPCAMSDGSLAVAPSGSGAGPGRPDPSQYMEYPEALLRNYPNLSDVEIVIIPNYPWTMNILKLESVDEGSRTCKTVLRASYGLNQITPGRVIDPNLWVQNAIDYLDEPGEWVVNTLERKLYYWPLEGSEPGDEVRIPLLREVVHVGGETEVEGPTDKPVKGIVFRDLTFMHADRDLWTEDDRGIQHDWLMEDKPDALLRFRGAEDCRVENCRFTNSGGNALRFDFHCRNMTVTGNEISHLGQGGINFIGYGPGTKDVNNYNTLTNNHIHHIGELYWHSHAIVLWQSGNNLVANNFIHDVPRKAVCLSGVRVNRMTRSYRDTPEEKKSPREFWKTIRWHEIDGDIKSMVEAPPYLHTRANMVEKNEIRNAINMLGDGAAINVSGAGLGNVIRNNLLYDMYNATACSVIRTDDWQDGSLYENNIIFRCHLRGMCLKGDNDVLNNFFVDVGCGDGKNRYVYSAETSGRYPFGDSRTERNVFVVNNPVVGFWKFISDVEQLSETTMDFNLFQLPVDRGNYPDFVMMDEAGFNENSVYADPMFRDPEHFDFSFLPGSPAPELGIKPISLEEVGLTEDFPARFNADPGFRGIKNPM